MPSKIYRDRLRNSIDFALREAADASSLNHPGLVGRVREICAENIIRPMLPAGFEVGTGKICDRHGVLTPELDLVIHHPTVLPPIMHGEREGIFALEASFYFVEVKSKLTASELDDCISKANKFKALSMEAADAVAFKGATPVLFAFGSDLAQVSSELERYAKYDPAWRTAPALKAICVVGRGYWYADEENACWYFHDASPERDEVIDLVSGISNTLAIRRQALQAFPLGKYLMCPRPVLVCR